MLSQVFVWSLVLEPLAFFVLFDRTVAGITGNLSRALQALVLLWLVGRFLFLPTRPGALIRMPSLSSPLYINYVRYFAVAVVAGIAGVVSGAYALPAGYAADVSVSAFSRMLNSVAVRPVFEYLITIYYFLYFVLLPQRLLRTPRALRYFFTTFRRTFIASFVLGVVDLGFSLAGYTLIPRHIADVWSRWLSVGPRFHGLAGEPRQAFVYLFCGLAILYADALYRGRPLRRWWVVAIIAAAFAAQSASGMVGIACFVGLFALYGLSRMSFVGIVRAVGIVMVVLLLLWGAATTSDRIMSYVESVSGLWTALENGDALPGAIAMQQFDIYPLYDLTVKARQGEIVAVLIGSGMGSSSMANNRYTRGETEFGNPSAQVVRIVYETGMLGLFFFVLAFFRPVEVLTRALPAATRRNFILLTFLAIGVCLGLRNSMVFIYVGVVIAMFAVMNRMASEDPAHAAVPRTPIRLRRGRREGGPAVRAKVRPGSDGR